MKKVIKISMRDVHAVMDHASKNFATIPAGARLMGSQRPMTEGERLALAYMGGAYMVAGGHGVDTAHLVILYDDSKVS
jgi:hypothetical protein